MSDQSQAVSKLTPHQSGVVQFRKLAESPAVMARFNQVLNERAPQFVASLVQLVSGNYTLAQCEQNSIMAAAITAASLNLPIDKNLGFAWIIPYKSRGQYYAQFQIGYKGLVQLAVRSGQYKFLNTCVVIDDELVAYNELTGELVLDKSKRKPDGAVIGYAAYFKLMNGFEHAEFWTKPEVEQHAKRFSQAYKSDYETPWKSDFDAMAMKTVLKSLLSHWGIMSIEMQKAHVRDQGVSKGMDAEVWFPDNQEDEGKRPIDMEPEPEQIGNGGEKPPVAQPVPEEAAKPKPERPPHEVIYELIKNTEGVTEEKVLKYLKNPSVKMAGESVTQITEVRDEHLRTLASNWKSCLTNIRKA